ncbi:MAG: alanine racemase [Bacilli bacterium]
MYPRLVLDYKKLVENTEIIVGMCREKGISVMGVGKSVCAWSNAIDAMVEGGIDYVADARIENLKKVKHDIPKVLLRLPIKSQISDVVKYSDISLNSSIDTISFLNEEAIKQNKVHKIVLMFDIGDLREGIYYKDDYKSKVEEILKFSNTKIIGIGTNLTCFGAVIPTKETLNKLEKIGKDLESTFNLSFEIKSFGNSSSIYLLDSNDDFSYFNNLRPGEAIVLGKETAYGAHIKGTHLDVFRFEAQIIEIYDKPTLPEGEIGVNAFGEKVSYEDRGVVTRAILGFGMQDVNYENLFPKDSNIEILGASSDHTIIEIKSGNYKIGDVVSFDVEYGSLLMLSTSEYVYKEVENGK